MRRGKEICEFLKRIRKDVADKYGLEYTPEECQYQGECSGTCPKCEAEIKDLQRQLEARGIMDIKISDIKVELPEFEEEISITTKDGEEITRKPHIYRGSLARPNLPLDTYVLQGLPCPIESFHFDPSEDGEFELDIDEFSISKEVAEFDKN